MALQASIKYFRAVPLSRTPPRVLLKWDISVTPGASLTEYEVIVMRGEAQDSIPDFQHIQMMTHHLPSEGLEAPDGRNEIVTPRIVSTDSKNTTYISRPMSAADFPWYLDHAQSLQMLTRPVYYKLILRKISTQEWVESPMVTFEGDLDMVGLYVAEEHNFLLEDAIGVPSLVYQRRRGGVPCPKCFDPISKKRMISQCSVCYGTNWAGGFHNPIDCYIDYSPNPKVSDIAQWGEVQPNESNILMSNYPELNPGDVIRELRQGRMWRVIHVTDTEKRRAPVLQFSRVTEIKPGDVEYILPQDDKLTLKKSEELEVIKLKREF